jgi:tetratricopeptide (TPR) repeat protein
LEKEKADMTSAASKNFVNIKIVLIGVIVATLAMSAYCDFRQQQKFKLDHLRDHLAFTDLFKLENADYAIERGQLEKYVQYFRAVVKNEPTRADAYAMLGYCYFYLNDKPRAITAYQKAIELKPKIFWFHYNLATVAMLQGHYEQALEEFQNALGTNPAENLDFLRNSKIFVYIIYKVKLINPSLGERLKNGYAMSAYYVAKCMEKLGGVREAALFQKQMQATGIQMPDEDAPLRLKIF